MRISVVNLLLMVTLTVFNCWSQPPNDGCAQATPLCPGQVIAASNTGATATVCPNCEDDFNFCFPGTNSVWFTFVTNTTGGNVSIDVSNLVFTGGPGQGTQLQGTIIQATVPCDASTFTALGNCVAGSTGNFTLAATGLPPQTTFYVVINGATNGGAIQPAEASFSIAASGSGFDRPLAGASISGPSGTICPNTPITFLGNLSNCTDTSAASWYLNGNLISVAPEFFLQTSVIQDGDVLTMECSCFTDCPQALTATFGPMSVENLYVDAGTDQTISSGESAILSGTTNGNSYYWTPAGSLATPNALQTTAIPTSTTTYFLTASSASCTISDDVTITVTDHFVIPGSFSPNGDGTNDTWIIKGIEFFPNAQVTIYDRWGQEVADIVGYSPQKAWDGTHKGKPVTDGVYFYVVDLRDSKYDEPFKGYVTVLR